MKMREAKRLLEVGDLRVNEVASRLGFSSPFYFSRRFRTFFGMSPSECRQAGEGDGVDPEMVRAISIPLAEPSVFVGLNQGTEFWLGPLPEMPYNMDIVSGLGGRTPNECVVLPIRVRSKTVCFLYCDNVDEGVAGLPMADLRRLIGCSPQDPFVCSATI